MAPFEGGGGMTDRVLAMGDLDRVKATQFLTLIGPPVPEPELTALDDALAANASLQRANDELSATNLALQQRVAELEGANASLVVADRQRNEFLAILAHELRNPLGPLRNAVHILNRSDDVVVGTKARQLIDRQVTHMARMVDDLLDAARAQNGQIRLNKSHIDIRRCIEHAVDLLKHSFDAKVQAVRVCLPDDPVLVDGDVTRLEHVFTNLLTNASKYTQRHGQIEVHLCTEQIAENVFAVTQVRDNGVGLDADLIPHIFELFSQADRSLAHSQGGLGIGLSL